MELTKDVEFNGMKYRVEKLPAKTAMYIAMQLFTKIMPFGVESQAGINNLPQNRQAMSEEEFDNLIDYCLLACKRYEMVGTVETAMPIMARKGVWAIKELEKDFMTVTALVVNVLAFNVKDFFSGGVLSELVKNFQGLSLFNTQA